jgi:hypothetical protein
MTLEIEKIPELLNLVASISAILGSTWKFNIGDSGELGEDLLDVSWHPDSSPDDYPVAVDFYTTAMQGPCVVQVWDLREPPEPSTEIRDKIAAVLAYCRSNNILYRFEQA